MAPRQGSSSALAGLVIAILCLIPALLMPDAEGGGVGNSVMICVLGAGFGLAVMVAGLAVVARTGLRVALLGLVTTLLCSAVAFVLAFYFDASWLGTNRMPPIVSLLIVALLVGGDHVGFIVMLTGMAMAGFGTLRRQRVT